MPDFHSLKELENYINKQISDSLHKDVVEQSKQLIKEHIEIDVYNKYPNPKVYDRSNNLEEAVSDSMINDGELMIYIDDNIAQSHHMYKDTEPLEPYANIVETGIGYDYEKPYPYNQPRPFFENTVEELKSGKAKEYLKNALKKRGLDVK
jgi:hypothetical protein